jgi:uncharacterized protein
VEVRGAADGSVAPRSLFLTPMPDPAALALVLLDDSLAICRLEADAEVPAWAWSGEPASVTRTRDELSIVCRADAVPRGVRRESGWRCLKVRGPLDFALAGVLAALAAPLAAAGIPVFVVSTFDTDYLMVKEENLARAAATLRAAGHRIG